MPLHVSLSLSLSCPFTDAADDDGLESVTINDGENEDERKKDNNKRKAGAGAGKEDTDDDEDDSSPFKIPTNSQMNSSLLKDQQEASSSSKIQKKLKKFKQLDDAEKQEEVPTTSNKSTTFKVPQTPEASEEPRRTKPHKKSATEELEDNGDSDGSLDGPTKSMPTKTKAQQKMFSDLPDPSPNFDRVLVVRIRRLKQSEIDDAEAAVSKSKFADQTDSPASRKRGRPRKSLNEKKSPSPAKKLKTTPTPKIHIKVPLQSGGKKRGLQQQLARNRTPPPPRSSMLKAPKRSNSKTLPPRHPRPTRSSSNAMEHASLVAWCGSSGHRGQAKARNGIRDHPDSAGPTRAEPESPTFRFPSARPSRFWAAMKGARDAPRSAPSHPSRQSPRAYSV